MKKLKYNAIFGYKNRDEMESRPMSETYSRLVIDVYMRPSEFAELVERFAAKDFIIEFKET